MNELLTRELTNEELALISGGEHSDDGFTADFGAIHSRKKYYFRSYQQYDLNGDGDGWDELSDVYGGVAVTAGIFAGVQALTGSPLAPVTGLVGAGFYAVASSMDFIDSYIIGTDRNIR